MEMIPGGAPAGALEALFGHHGRGRCRLGNGEEMGRINFSRNGAVVKSRAPTHLSQAVTEAV